MQLNFENKFVSGMRKRALGYTHFHIALRFGSTYDGGPELTAQC